MHHDTISRVVGSGWDFIGRNINRTVGEICYKSVGREGDRGQGCQLSDVMPSPSGRVPERRVRDQAIAISGSESPHPALPRHPLPVGEGIVWLTILSRFRFYFVDPM